MGKFTLPKRAPIELNVIQQGPEWVAAHLGRLSSRHADKLVTPTGKASSQREAVLSELLAEWATGQPFSSWGGNEATERGLELEDDALALYSFETGREWRAVGSVYRDSTRTAMSSPDGLVGDDECVELKCPFSPGQHLAYLFRNEVPKKYLPQCQWHHWVTGRAVTFMSFYPGLPPLIVAAEIDATYQAALDSVVPEFLGEMESGKAKLRAMGIDPAQLEAA